MIIKHNAITSSSRFLSSIDRSCLHKGKPYKGLCYGVGKNSGRNNRGVITVRHKGGGHKKKVRLITFDFNSFLKGVDALDCIVERIEYDPRRSAFIALCKCVMTCHFFYVVAVEGLKVGDNFSILNGSQKKKCGRGFIARLSNITSGTTICCVESKVAGGMNLARSAGSYATLIKKYDDYALVSLRSGITMNIPLECFAIVGVVSNGDHNNRSYAKAGRRRWLGIRPCVRGVVMNPVDHPHGGGEGKSKSGRHPCSPWGVLTKGKKTVKKKY